MHLYAFETQNLVLQAGGFNTKPSVWLDCASKLFFEFDKLTDYLFGFATEDEKLWYDFHSHFHAIQIM